MKREKRKLANLHAAEPQSLLHSLRCQTKPFDAVSISEKVQHVCHDMVVCIVVGRVPLTDETTNHQQETREEAVVKRACSKADIIVVLSAMYDATVRRSEHE